MLQMTGLSSRPRHLQAGLSSRPRPRHIQAGLSSRPQAPTGWAELQAPGTYRLVLLPSRPTMMISTTIGNTALIQWQPPKEMVGEHVGYQLQYKRMEEESFTVKDFKKTDDHFTVTGLHKGATYVFKLCAKNRAGTGEEYVKEITTPDDVPSSYPQNLSVVGLTTTTTKLAWEPPALAERNGRIVQYVVVTTETQMTIMGLQPDTTYDIRVRAFTSKGPGPNSPSIQSRTMSTSMPEFTKNFGVKAVMKTSVLLTWEVPETYKSQILYNQQSVEVQGNLKRKLISRLQPDTDYSFVLMSRGNSAGGLQQQVSIRTAPDLLKTKPIQYQPDLEEGGRLTITLPKVPTTAPVRPYIAAKMTALPDTFTLGDEKKYNGFYNKPLPGQQQYLCF
ncbi:unnamed protein product, partial [Coregonus sp. 'balchen']